MCLAVPGKIIFINEADESSKMAKVSFGGAVRDICLDLTPEAKINDYVLVHVGFSMNVIDEAEAEKTIRLISELIEAGEEQ